MAASGSPLSVLTQSSDDPPDALTEPEASLRSTLVGLARSAAIRYSIMLPKIKAANFFQPEDHVKTDHIHGSLQGARLVGLTHTASIFASGTLLFVVQERALRRLEPTSGGDFGQASPLNTALAGACGGAAYGLAATSTHAWLGTGSLSLKKWSFLTRALPYTLPRDAGGFGLYFGVYNLTHRTLSGVFASASAPAVGTAAATKAPPAVITTQPAGAQAVAGAAPPQTPQTPPSGLLSVSSPMELAGALSTIAISGALSGLCTYMWRTPWDTLYKQAIGWRDPTAPLWSFDRFLRSPRGLKAVGVGALTWSAYEIADAGLRYLAAESQPSGS